MEYTYTVLGKSGKGELKSGIDWSLLQGANAAFLSEDRGRRQKPEAEQPQDFDRRDPFKRLTCARGGSVMVFVHLTGGSEEGFLVSWAATNDSALFRALVSGHRFNGYLVEVEPFSRFRIRRQRHEAKTIMFGALSPGELLNEDQYEFTYEPLFSRCKLQAKHHEILKAPSQKDEEEKKDDPKSKAPKVPF